jgi:hypothetical protein
MRIILIIILVLGVFACSSTTSEQPQTAADLLNNLMPTAAAIVSVTVSSQ